MTSELAPHRDPDLAQVGKALERAARRAREIARRTNTVVVFLRDGVIVEEHPDESLDSASTDKPA